jgi:hypothetical protein
MIGGERKSRGWRIALFALLVVGTNVPMWASAATAPETRPTAPLDLTTSPLPITLATKPGTTISTNIKVKQSGGDTEQLQVHLLKFTAYGDSGQPALSDRGPGDTYFDWVTFDKPTFTAPSDVWQTIKMTIQVPKTAAFEYNYAVEFTRVGDDLSPGHDEEGIAGGTAVLVLLDAQAPGETRSVQLESFGVEHRIVEFLPDTFDIKFYNNGNVFVQPAGDVFITQGSHQIADIAVNDEQGNILAGTHRIYKVEWTDGFPYYQPVKKQGQSEVDRHGNPIMALNWNLPTNASAALNDTEASTTSSTFAQEGTNPLSRLRFGEYTARLVAIYKDNYGRDVPITSQVTFWVIPWRILMAFLLVLAVFGFAIYSLIRGARRRMKRMQRIKRRRP